MTILVATTLALVTAGGSPETVPFEWARPGIPLITLDVRVNGNEPRKFVLDTGNSRDIVLSKAYAEQLGLELKESSNAHPAYGVGSGKVPQLFEAELKSFAVGKLEKKGGKVEVSSMIDNIAKSAKLDVVGNIGYGFLKDYALTIDYPGKTLTFTPDPVADPKGVPFELGKRPLAQVKVLVNGKGPFAFVVDTGASASCISTEMAATLELKLGAAVPMLGAAGSSEGHMVKLDSLELAGRNRKDLLVIAADFFGNLSKVNGSKVDGILGYDFMNGAKLTIDYPNRLLSLEGQSD